MLQQFHRKKENLSWEQTPERAAPCSPTEGAVDIETPPGSPPSQDSAYFSQPGSEDSGAGARSAPTSPATVSRQVTT